MKRSCSICASVPTDSNFLSSLRRHVERFLVVRLALRGDIQSESSYRSNSCHRIVQAEQNNQGNAKGASSSGSGGREAWEGGWKTPEENRRQDGNEKKELGNGKRSRIKRTAANLINSKVSMRFYAIPYLVGLSSIMGLDEGLQINAAAYTDVFCC